jgi:acid phosphatase
MLSFLVLGDWGRRGHRTQSAVARGLARAAQTYNAEFIITTGDNFREKGVEGVLDPQWHDSFDAVYDAPELDLPWYASLGDCDHRGNVAAQAEYAKHDLRWRMSDQFYSINKRVDDQTHAQFVFLDTTPLSEDRDLAPNAEPALQLYWLRNMLAPSRSDWKIVIGHHGLSSLHTRPDGGDAVAPVLQQFGAQLYLCGYDHRLQQAQTEGIHEVLSGAGAGAEPATNGESQRPVAYQNATPGFAVVTLDGLSMTTRFCNADGDELFSNTVEIQPHRQAA